VDMLSGLNDPQRLAVTTIDGPLLVIAGPGSGKTRVITRRVAYLISQGISPRNILALTFTNKAAGEMLNRMGELKAPPGATICTFHSLCARLLREFADEAGVSRNFSIYDRDEQVSLVKGVLNRLDLATHSFPPGRVHSAISRAKNALQTPEQFAAQANGFYEDTVAKVYRRYQEQLADNNALDFDDLLMRMVLLLRDRPEVREALTRRFRYILIDEYQDTNHAQYVIAHGIAMGHENICVTGDPDQSIYAWRGADIRNILEFESDYPNATVVRLDENYRSSELILAAASRLISHNTMRKEKSLWTRRKGGSDVRVVLCDDEHAESETVARRIATHRASGGAYSDVAVFYRINSLSRVVEQEFLNFAVPYRIARGVEFFNRKEVKDTIAYLRVLVNPSDDLSCRRIINTPPRGIGAVTIKRLTMAAEARGISLLAACDDPGSAGLGKSPAGKVAEFAQLIRDLSAGMDRPVRSIMEDVVTRAGLSDYLRSTDRGEYAYANVEELISTAEEFDRSAPADANRLEDYLHQVSLVSDTDHVAGADGAVTLMSLHAAKGLEFPKVFIIGWEQGLLPLQREDDRLADEAGRFAERLEEERRLGFVGMTRAKDDLTLTCARQRMIRGRTVPQSVSAFISEIGAQGVRIEDLTTREPERPQRARRGGGGFYQDIQERQIIESTALPRPLPPEYEYLRPGCRVRHPKFGLGVVRELSRPWPETRATIDFKQWGVKKIVLSRTSIELLDSDQGG